MVASATGGLEKCRPADVSRLVHEYDWEKVAEHKRGLSRLTIESGAFVQILTEACNVPNLIEAVLHAGIENA